MSHEMTGICADGGTKYGWFPKKLAPRNRILHWKRLKKLRKEGWVAVRKSEAPFNVRGYGLLSHPKRADPVVTSEVK